MVKRVLLIAYHYPPVKVSSGIQRTLTLSRYLPDFGWQPSVLTAHPRAYQALSDDQLAEIPAQMTVCRAFALDTSRHLAICGRYWSLLSLPDRWVSWWLGGVLAGLQLIRRERPALLWSTYPIATAHLIGLTLHRLTGIPWVADCRDSMTEDSYPRDPRQRRVFLWLERQLVQHAAKVVFTTPGALRMYAARYPTLDPARWAVVANGYDEENFRGAEQANPPLATKRRRLVHSGVLYPSERDPSGFFAALAALKQEGRIRADCLEVVLRATGHDDDYRQRLVAQGIDDIVTLAPNIAYEQALREMLEADGLLLFQARNCNHQIPAKVYEYLRAQRPVFALTDAEGDTAQLLQTTGGALIVPLDDGVQIKAGLCEFLDRLAQGTAAVADLAAVARHSRYARAQEMAAIFEAVRR